MRIVAALCSLLMLAACADPAQVARIRPGIGSDIDLDAIRPPSGVKYVFSVEQGGLPIPARVELTSRRRSANVYDYTGAMVFRVPGSAAQLSEVARLVTGVFKAKGPRIRGNEILIPVRIRTDNRFRSTASSLLSANDMFVPHDCFAQLGTCRYKGKRGDRSVDFISETTEKNGVWRTVTRADPRTAPPVLKGDRDVLTYSIDRNAVIIDMAINRQGAGRKDISVFKRQ